MSRTGWIIRKLLSFGALLIKLLLTNLTKPLTGEKFHHFRLKIMNMKELKMESLRPKTPKDTGLSQLEKPNDQKLRKTAIR